MMMVVLRMVMSRGRQMKKKKKKMMMIMMLMMIMMMMRRRRRHVTGAILCENLQVKCRRPDGSHDRDPDFVQTCTVEMHLDMSQEQFVGAVAVEMHLDMSEDVRRCQKSHSIREFTGKMPQTKTATQTLCEPAQSKCTWTCHKSHFVEEITGKMPPPRWSTLIKHRPHKLL